MLINGEVRGPSRPPSKFLWPSKHIAESTAAKRREELEKLGVTYLGTEEESKVSRYFLILELK